jgi:hypothetical protein
MPWRHTPKAEIWLVPIEHRRQLTFSISLKPLRLRSSRQRKAGRSPEKEGDFIVARISREKQREGESILLASLQSAPHFLCGATSKRK